MLKEASDPLAYPLPYQLVGSHFTFGWEITKELRKLTLSAHIQIRKV